ncbi:succinate dehydrogenase, cytochrome b556 subunit [Asticcacaulis sp. BYS171W]|uniref:Succinate dehydrogenase cytochrome b556 subunit n=1 Tax=Asticcacaulis aquaticus TaxID=2984212 RepID=A0ABT5HRC4_9CAUL|nr:succinate dehydrogenase, cytochrome b556 subunit [Asticcacaulis aquaticus]MDC7682617.1 succinate dehydrogenase, cytochrome b556 subunit [Asticcacaulis aquaticus]
MSQPPSKPTVYRPLSPHLQVWKFHITMFTSILHRATGLALVVGAVLVAAWLLAIGLTASGCCPQAYTSFLTFAASPFGLFIWFGLSLAGFIHLTGGIRHLIWDLGLGFQLKSANALSWWGLLIGIALTIVFWVVLFATGKVVL